MRSKAETRRPIRQPPSMFPPRSSRTFNARNRSGHHLKSYFKNFQPSHRKLPKTTPVLDAEEEQTKAFKTKSRRLFRFASYFEISFFFTHFSNDILEKSSFLYNVLRFAPRSGPSLSEMFTACPPPRNHAQARAIRRRRASMNRETTAQSRRTVFFVQPLPSEFS